MGLIDEARTYCTVTGPSCAVGRLMEVHPDLVDELAEAIAADIPGAAIGRALRARGHSISEGSLQRHRRGDCRCDTR